MTMHGRFAILCAGLWLAAALAAARLDFVVAYDLSARPEGLPRAGTELTHTTTLLKGGAPLGEPVVGRRAWSGKATQAFASAVEVEGAETAEAVRHELAYVAASGAQVRWQEERRLLPVPFAAHARVASGGLGGNFALLADGTKATADRLDVTQGLQGISRATPDLTAERVEVAGGLRVRGDVGERPSLAAQTLRATGEVRLGAEGNILPDGLCVGLGTVPEGAIIAWTDPDSDPGEGWVLCDGSTEDTPDLRGLFPEGTLPEGGKYILGEPGGATAWALREQEMPAHTHTADVRVPKNRDFHFNTVTLKTGQAVWGRGVSAATVTTASAGGGEAHENLPPWFAVRFYMRKGVTR